MPRLHSVAGEGVVISVPIDWDADADADAEPVPSEVKRLLVIWTRAHGLDLPAVEREIGAAVPALHARHERGSSEPLELSSPVQELVARVERKVAGLVLDGQYDRQLETWWQHLERQLRISIGSRCFLQLQSQMSGSPTLSDEASDDPSGPVRLEVRSRTDGLDLTGCTGRAPKSQALHRLETPRKARPSFNYQLLRRYSPRLSELRQKAEELSSAEIQELDAELMRLIDEAERAEATVVGARRMLTYCDTDGTPKAKRLKHLSDEAEPLLRAPARRPQASPGRGRRSREGCAPVAGDSP